MFLGDAPRGVHHHFDHGFLAQQLEALGAADGGQAADHLVDIRLDDRRGDAGQAQVEFVVGQAIAILADLFRGLGEACPVVGAVRVAGHVFVEQALQASALLKGDQYLGLRPAKKRQRVPAPEGEVVGIGGFGDVGIDDAPVIKNAGEHRQASLRRQLVHQLAPRQQDRVVLAHHPVQFDHTRPQAIAAGIHTGQQAGVAQILDVAIRRGARQAHAFGDGVRVDPQRRWTEQVQDTQQFAQAAHFVPRKGGGVARG